MVRKALHSRLNRPPVRQRPSGSMVKKSKINPPAKRPAAEVRDENGADVTLLRWMLSLTPSERLRAGQQFANAITRLRARRPKA